MRWNRSHLSLAATIAGVAAVVIGLAAFGLRDGSRSGPVLSEIVASNSATLEVGGGIPSEDGTAEALGSAEEQWDWIELHNPTDGPIDLDGWRLSDGDDPTTAWVFPSVVMESDEYLVVYASGLDRREQREDLHTDFRLDRVGEPVTLIEPTGGVVADRFPAVELPRNVSFGRDPADPGRTCYFAYPTPGGPNAPECFDDTELGAPRFSVPSGAYPDPFEVEVLIDDRDAEILVTVDGSFPDMDHNSESTFRFDRPLAMGSGPVDDDGVGDSPTDGVVVVRARTPFGAESSVTYLLGETAGLHDLPVVALAIDDEFLYDHDTGLLVPGRIRDEFEAGEVELGDLASRHPGNFQMRGRDWERPFAGDPRRAAIVTVCDTSAGCNDSTRVGVRVHGGASRAHASKALRLYTRPEYGSEEFGPAVFGDLAPSGHRRILLRASGNDTSRLRFLDGYLQSLMRDVRADTQAYRPAVLYVNGEYWGIYNLRERYDAHYVEVVHGVPADSVEVVEGNLFAAAPDDPDAASVLDAPLADVIGLDPASPEFVEIVDRYLDVDSFFDFVLANVVVGNRDWPGNNSRAWRATAPSADPSPGPGDGRWRWMIHDLDLMGGGLGTFDPDVDLFVGRFAPTDDPTVQRGRPYLFHQMMQNGDYRDRFLTRAAELLNTTFHPDRTVTELDRLVAMLESEMGRNRARWSGGPDLEPWYGWVEGLRSFMVERPDAQRRLLVAHFDLDGVATVVVGPTDGGHVRVGSVDIVASVPGAGDDGRWTGEFFAGVPLEIEAVPAPGWELAGWADPSASDLGTSLTLRPPAGSTIDVTPVFRPVD